MEFQDPGLKESTSAKLRADDDGVRSEDEKVSLASDGGTTRLVEEEARTVAESPAEIGQAQAAHRIADYSLHGLLARNAQAEVWRGADAQGAAVAIKIFNKELSSNPDNVKRISQEVKNLRRVMHPGVVSVLGSGETSDGCHYIAMEYVEGPTIKTMLETEGVFEPLVAAKIVREACRALAAAHQKEIIHRDIKPSNIIVTADNTAKLIDFGVAKATGYSGETITQLGDVVGTPEYMSPEQCLGGLIDQRSDIYSLGCTLFEMLTGFKAFPAATTVEAIAKQISNDRSEIRNRIKMSGIPAPLQQIVIKCLEREPSQRYQQVAELDHDLGAFLLGTKPKFAAKRRFATQKYMYLMGAAVVAGLFASVATFVFLIESAQPSAAPLEPPLHSGLLPGQIPNIPLPALQNWIDAQVTDFKQNHKLDDTYIGGIEKDLSQRFNQAPYGLAPDGKGIVYFHVGANGSVTDIHPVGWRTPIGNVAARGSNISLIESMLTQSPFAKPSAPKHLAMVFVGSDFVIKDVATLPSNMQLRRF